jgi:hypothetical protein
MAKVKVTYDPTQQQVVPVDQAKVTTTVEDVDTAAQQAAMSARIKAALARIRELFPDYVFFFDTDAGGFGQDVRDLLVRAVEANYTDDRFLSEYKQTSYYKETADKVKLWNAKSPEQKAEETRVSAADLQANYGDLFDFEGADTILQQIAGNVARLGLTGNRLKNFIYAEAIRLRPTGMKPPTLESAAADALRTTVREYGYTPSDDEINSILTGQPDRKGIVLNDKALIERAKNSAKALYPHLSQQLDAGLSLDDLFKNYRTYASQYLELDPNQIDFVKDPKWARAFGTAQTGPMSLADWERELKTNKDYGWQFTNQANQQVSSVVSTLERAFGLVR